MVDLGLIMTMLDVSMYDWIIEEVFRSPKLEPKAVLYLRLNALASRVDSEMDESEMPFLLSYIVCSKGFYSDYLFLMILLLVEGGGS